MNVRPRKIISEGLSNICEQNNIATTGTRRIQLHPQQVRIRPTTLLVEIPQRGLLCVHENGGHTSRHLEHQPLRYIFIIRTRK
jgi:hypothetical protein